MKELMENGPVQGKCPSSCPLVPKACVCLRLGTPNSTSGLHCTGQGNKSTGAGSQGNLVPSPQAAPCGGHLGSWYGSGCASPDLC